MKKTIPITLSNFAYTLDEDAYEKLKKYIEDIRIYLAKTDSKESADEIIGDIESSIAVKFSAKLKNNKEVISIADVDELIKLMGSVEDIAGEEGQDARDEASIKKTKIENSNRRRLYRDVDDAVIAGVASGIASYFGIDPIFVRLLFVVSVFFGGMGVVIYLILWIVIPKAQTATQRLEMQGDPITLKKLEQLAREKTAELKNIDKGKIRGFINSLFGFIGSVFKFILKFFINFGSAIGVVLGIVIIISSTLVITAVGSALAALAFNVDSPYFNIPGELVDVIGYSILQLASLSAFFVIFVPLIFLILLGASLTRRKNVFNLLTSLILIATWMIAVIVLGAISLNVAPEIEKQVEAYNSLSKMSTKEIAVEEFDKIEISSVYEANIVSGDKYSVFVAGKESDLEKVSVGVFDGKLLAEREESDFCLFCFGSKKLMLEITTPDLAELDVSDASSVTVGGFKGDSFKINLSDASHADLNLNYDNLELDVSDASRVKLNIASSSSLILRLSDASQAEIFGMTDMLEIGASGASVVKAYQLKAMKTSIDVSDASRVQVNAVDSMDVKASDVGRVYYRGNPVIVSDQESFVLPGMPE